jgi:hypothetical protein
MTFIVNWSIDSAIREEVNARFKATGAPPPEGVKIVGRWHNLDGSGGLAILESSDPVAIGKHIQEWSDLLEFQITPCGDDAVVAQIIA